MLPCRSDRHLPTLFWTSLLTILFLQVALFGGSALASHKLAQQECYDCHSVGGRKDVVVQGTRLIKADGRMTEIQGGGWISGNLPCVYCHQDISGTRLNMVGVKDNFSPLSISKHPVDYLISNAGSSVGGTYIGGNLYVQCVDCHVNVQYVNSAPNPGSTINPNIHGVNTASVSATDTSGGNLQISTTFYSAYSPYNSDNNDACMLRCHDPGYTDVDTQKQYHAYGSTLITLETSSAPFTTAPGGCLSLTGSPTGCHGIHNSQGNTDIITLNKPAGGYVTRNDCGTCHNFDDPDVTGDRSGSEFMLHGHGKGTVNVSCTQCHDSAKDHFDPAADPQDSRLLSYIAGSSEFSSPPKALNANCQLCHSAYQPHSTTQVRIGCLDCHDPHGRGIEVGGVANIRMVRRVPPVAASTAMIAYTTQGVYWDSTSYGQAATFTNTACDNKDCHIGPSGPGPINAIMDSTTGTHSGGTGTGVFDCQGCHTHTDTGGSMRATESCSTCHGDSLAKTNWPDNTTILVGAWPDREGSHQVHVDAIIAGNPGISEGNATCDYCHPQGKHTDDGVAGDQDIYPATIHRDGVGADTTTFKTMNSGSDSDGAYTISGQTCSDINCHGNTTSPNWYTGPAPVACGQCHTNPPPSGSHSAHADIDSDFTECYECHTDNAGGGGYSSTPSGTHNDGQTTFTSAITYNNQASQSVTDDTCLTSVCHSADTAAPLNYATWGSPSSVGCSECHYGDTAAPTSSGNGNSGRQLTGSHDAHFDATGMTILCADCHQVPVSTSHSSAVAASDGPVLVDRALAAQNEADVSTTALGPSGNDPDLAGTPDPTCNNFLCHNPSDDIQKSAVWGTVNTGCEMCHNTATAPVTVPSGSHSMHVSTRGYACTACHVDNNNPVPNPGHLNQVIDFPNFTYTGTADDYPGSYGSCNTGSCHEGTIVWGSTPTNCDQCHVSALDINDYNGTNQQASYISTTEWNNAGHGAKTVNCLDCHGLGVAHDSSATLGSANAFRFSATFQTNGCTDNAANCHDGNPTPSVATVVTHTSQAMSTAGYSAQVNTWGFDPKCVDCHDPHGDGANLKMIQTDLFDSGSGANRVPVLPVENSSLVFTDTTTGADGTGNSYADTAAPFSSLCQECHETTDPDMTSFLDNATASSTNHPSPGGNPGDCSTCHTHDSAFMPSGCSGCHGNAGSDTYWPDGIAYPDRAGEHSTHINALQSEAGLTTSSVDQQSMCAYCHNDGSGVGGGTHADYVSPADVGAFNRIWDATTDDGTYTPGDGTNGTCASVDCHDNKSTSTAYDWYDGAASACVMCHDDVTATGTATGDVHVSHADSTAYGRVVVCADCHDNATDWSTGTPPAAGHRNGAWTLDHAYSGSWSAGTFGTCTTTICHNDGTGTAVVSPQWGTTIADPTCNICHSDSPTTLNHPTHLTAVYGPQITLCGDCHDPETAVTHIDTSVTFADANTLSPTVACDTCHAGSPVTAKGYWGNATGTWLGAGGYCEHCHDSTPSTVGIAAPNMMGDASTYGAGVKGHNKATGTYVSGVTAAALACTSCHDSAKPHFDSINGDSFTDTNVRYLDTINTQTGFGVVEDVCGACHQASGGSTLNVANHGNVNSTFTATTTHDANAEQFAYRCDACHEPHGLTSNGTGYNIYMVKGSVEVMNYSTPGAGSTTTDKVPMVFEARTGTDSFDDGLTQTNNICVACHNNNPRPSGTGTAMLNVDGNHSENNDYTNNEQGNNCTSCHQHDYDANPASADGFMPLQCDGCHSYPPASNAHAMHTTVLPAGYNFTCNECHSGNLHNESGILSAAGYSATSLTVSNNIDIGFDTTNPGGTYAPVKGSRVAAGAGTCSVTYCHGNESAGDQSDWAGSDMTPAWNSAAKNCGSCHADPPASGAHGLHTDVGGDTGRADCDLCHTGASGYSTPTASHVNEVTNVDAGYTGDTGPTAADGYCNSACHESSAVDDRWNDGELLCNACHYYEVTPVSGNNVTAGDMEQISKVSHDGHFDATGLVIVCTDCHVDNAGDGGGATVGVTLSHITVSGTSDSARITGMAAAGQDEAAIDTTGSWFGAGTWTDGTDTCTNVCHDPAGGQYAGSGVWGNTNTGCSMCHEAVTGVPGTGSHSAHVSTTVAATYGIAIACSDCHGPDPVSPDHMQGTVDFAIAATGYNGNAGTPYGEWGGPYSNCTTTDCHNDGTGTAVPTPTWGTASATACATCHSDSPITNAHNEHLGGTMTSTYGRSDVSCGTCHAAETAATHINSGVTMAADGANYSAATVVGDAAWGNCNNNACHEDGTASAPVRNSTWTSTLTDDCASCHQGSGMITNAHDPHLASNSLPGSALTFGVTDECVACHDTTASGVGDASGVLHLNSAADLSFTAAYDYEALTAQRNGAATGGTTTCSDVRCHNGVTTPQWNSAVACGSCHNTAATGPLPAQASIARSHSAHADNNADYSDCAICHVNAASYSTGHADHQNLAVEMVPNGGTYTETDGKAGINYAGADFTDDGVCASTICHGPSTPQWGVPGSVSCGSCHAGGVTNTLTSLTHAGHGLSSGTIAADEAECERCHPTADYTQFSPANSHNDSAVNLDAAKVDYDIGVTNTCETASCHNNPDNGGDRSTVWDTATKLACNDCHYYEGTVVNNTNNAAHKAPLTNRHDSHFDKAKQCSSCHTVPSDAGAENTAHIDGVTDLVDKSNADYPEAAITGPTWVAPNCTAGIGGLGCHASAPTSPSWLAASLGCTDCHTPQATSSGFDPYTGIHYQDAGFPNTDAHDGSFGSGYGCTNCHRDPATDAHATGTLNTPATATFSFVTTGVSVNLGALADSTDDACTANCHSEFVNAGGKTWARKWSSAAYSSASVPGDARCAVCHGDFATGWNAGVSPSHVRADLNNTANHETCKICHNIEDTTYTWGTHHENDQITMNVDPTVAYDGSTTPTYGCDGGVCHANDAGHRLADSAWPLNEVDGPQASCANCHGNATAGVKTYYPDGSGPHTADDEAGRHSFHIGELESRLGYATGTSVDAEQKAMCAYCHEDPAGGTFATLHNNATVNVTGEFRMLDGTVAGAADADGTYTDATGYDGSCAAVDCHNTKTTDITPATATGGFGWYDVGTSTCTMCHTRPAAGSVDPNSGLHTASTPTVSGVIHDDTLTACTTCHSTLTVQSTHINNANNSANATSMGLFVTYTQAADNQGSCSGTGVSGGTCHGVAQGAGDNGQWARVWDASVNNANTGTTECRGCHGVFGSWTFGGDNVAGDGAVSHERNWDGDGNGAEIEANHDGTDKCIICHNYDVADTYYTWTNDHRDNTIQMNSNSTVAYNTTNWGCDGGVCHGTAAANHNLEDSGFTVTGQTGPAASCQSCHGTGGVGVGGANSRRDIQTDFTMNSHHINAGWTTIDGDSCQQCHDNSNHTGGTVNLWTNDAKSTSVAFNLGNLVSANAHCLHCHDDGSSASTPFSVSGDSQTPVVKAFDSYSIDSKYNNTGTTPMGKYDSSSYNVNPSDQIPKAFSPHGNILNNRGGIATTGAWSDRGGAGDPTGTWPGTRTGTSNIACMDCHNSHGSNVTTVWWKGAGTQSGGILRSNRTFGGTSDSYTPTAGTGYNAEVDLCWDCHYGDGGAGAPTYTSYGSFTQKIGHYRENTSSGPGRWTGTWNNSFSFMDASLQSDHLNIFSTTMASTPTFSIAGAGMGCSACHDPHGVSSSRSATQDYNYMVPALKGTWLSTPYKQDRPPRDNYSVGADDFTNSTSVISGSPIDPYAGRPAPRANPYFNLRYTPDSASQRTGTTQESEINYNVPEVTGNGWGVFKYTWNNITGAGTSTTGSYQNTAGNWGWNGYFIDDNTFGVTNDINSWNMGPWDGQGAANEIHVTVKHIDTENTIHGDLIDQPSEFAGLCMECHNQAAVQNLTSNNGPYAGLGGVAQTTKWSTTTYVHRVVAGTTWNNITTNLFRTGSANSVGNMWYSSPVTNHGLDHAPGGWYSQWTGTTSQSYADFEDGVGNVDVDTDKTDEYVTTPGASGSIVFTNKEGGNPENAHMYGWGVNPYTQGADTKGTPTDGVQGDYHKFPCSKCHSPHAARLPRLMITNCLDTAPQAINTSTGATNFNSNSGSSTRPGPYMTGGYFQTNQATMWRAVSCHSTGNGGKPRGSGSTSALDGSPPPSGWNDVTPW